MTRSGAAFSRLVLRPYLGARRAFVALCIHAPRKRAIGVAPGRTPLFRNVLFELRTRCNSRCAFCAAGVATETRPDVTMPFDTYARVVDDLAGLGYEGEIGFHGNNEPLMVPDLDRYVALARERLPKSWIRIFTNGLSLSRKKGEALLAAGIDEMTVNWYAAGSGAPLPAHLIAFRDEVLPRFHPRARVRRGTGPLRPGDRSIFRFNLYRRRLDEVLDSRAGSSPNKTALPENVGGFCDQPFSTVNITADGRVGRCCADFYFEDVMGNVPRQSLLEIWNGAPLRAAREMLLRGDRSGSALCSRCDHRGVDLGLLSPVARVAEAIVYRLDRLLLPAAPAAGA